MTDSDPMQEAARWLRFLGMQEAREIIDDALTVENNADKEENKRRVYELTDGENSKRAIARMTGVPRGTVGSWHRQWAQLGIVNKDGARDPYEHLISLKALGLDRPADLKPEEDEDE